MKKIPKTLEIGGKTFKIKMYKKMPKDVHKELGDCAGWCDWEEGVLGLIEKYCDKDNLTFFHEIGHAAADVVKSNNALLNEAFARPFFAIFYAALRSAGLIK
jgi:hypothetical protein